VEAKGLFIGIVMKRLIGTAVLGLALFGAVPAFAQEAPPPPPGAVEEYAPPPAPVTATTGEWVDTDAYGEIWVPNNSQTVMVSGRPYAYFYTPAYGWTWYVSPWGGGYYHRGEWVHAQIAPHVYYHNTWVVHPHARYNYRPAVIYHAPPARRAPPPAHHRR
jgi:hypothetical protein